MTSGSRKISIKLFKSGGKYRIIVLAFACALIIKLFFFDLMIAQGWSMTPAIVPGSLLLINKAAYGIRIPVMGIYLLQWSAPMPGEIIVFFTPVNDRVVKRSYSIDDNGAVFFRGDNELESFDSRYYGSIPLERIIGRALIFK